MRPFSILPTATPRDERECGVRLDGDGVGARQSREVFRQLDRAAAAGELHRAAVVDCGFGPFEARVDDLVARIVRVIGGEVLLVPENQPAIVLGHVHAGQDLALGVHPDETVIGIVGEMADEDVHVAVRAVRLHEPRSLAGHGDRRARLAVLVVDVDEAFVRDPRELSEQDVGRAVGAERLEEPGAVVGHAELGLHVAVRVARHRRGRDRVRRSRHRLARREGGEVALPGGTADPDLQPTVVFGERLRAEIDQSGEDAARHQQIVHGLCVGHLLALGGSVEEVELEIALAVDRGAALLQAALVCEGRALGGRTFGWDTQDRPGNEKQPSETVSRSHDAPFACAAASPRAIRGNRPAADGECSATAAPVNRARKVGQYPRRAPFDGHCAFTCRSTAATVGNAELA